MSSSSAECLAQGIAVHQACWLVARGVYMCMAAQRSMPLRHTAMCARLNRVCTLGGWTVQLREAALTSITSQDVDEATGPIHARCNH